MTALIKPQLTRSGPLGEGCWAFDNTDDHSSISGKFYGLVVPDKQVSQLDDLAWYEEAEFWRLNFDVACNALERLESETGEPQTMLLGVNDGYHVGQSIPHVHSHIVVTEETEGVEEFFMFRDMERAIDTLRRAFCPAATPPPSRTHVMCNVDDIEGFTWALKYKRDGLREKGLDVFRIYTGSPFMADFKHMFFTLDATNADHPQFSFSQAWRALHGRAPYENLARPLGRGKYTHFAPETPSLS